VTRKLVVVVIGAAGPDPVEVRDVAGRRGYGGYLPVEEGVTGRPDPVARIKCLWLDDDAPLDPTRVFDGLRVEAYAVDERVQWDRGGETVTRVSFVRRAHGLSHEEFADHWTRVHAPLARKHHPTLRRYVQNVVVESVTAGAPEVDGIAELGFRNLKDVHDRMYDSPAGAEIIRRDIQRFLDVPAGWRMLARRLPPPS
jgi:uncharacterized protein (TIGR02118 family)